jgi:hypothetical protein
MKEIIIFFRVLVMVSLFLFTGCASTDFTYVWMDKTYQGSPLKHVLVIAMITPQTLRESLEDQLVQQMKDKGINGIPSYTVFSDEKNPAKEEILRKIKELGADSVLITTLIGINQHEAFIPYCAYSSAVGICTYIERYCPMVVFSGHILQFETKIIELNNDTMIWSTLSNTELIRYPEDMTLSFSNALVDELYSMKLIQ